MEGASLLRISTQIYGVIISSLHDDMKSGEVLLVHRTFLELHSKTELQRSPAQLKKPES